MHRPVSGWVDRALRLWAIMCLLVFAACGGGGGSKSKTPPSPQPVAPTLTTDLADVTVETGKPASFHVAVSGTQPFTYTWTVNGTAVTCSTDTYTIPSAQAADGGKRIKVEVANAAGKVSSREVTLTVTPVVGGNLGNVAPLFSRTTWDGRTCDVASMRGKVLLVCFDCKNAFVDFEKVVDSYRAKYGDVGLEVIIVVYGDGVTADDLRMRSTNYGITSYVIYDQDNSIVKAYGPEGYPNCFIIDRDGTVVASRIGVQPDYLDCVLPLYVNRIDHSPEIYTDLNDVFILQEGGIQLYARVIARPRPDIRWFLNDQVVSVEGETPYLDMIKNGDRIRVEFRNPLGIVSSREAHVAVDPAFGDQPGKKAAGFRGTTWDGQNISLGNYRDKTVLIAFVDASCGFSRSEAAFMEKVYSDYRAQGVEVVMFLTDTSGNAAGNALLKAWCDQYKPSFPVVLGGGLSSMYKTASFPVNWIVDRGGYIRARIDGAQEAKIREALDAVIAAPDYVASVTPAAIAPGQSRSTAVSVTRAGGHTAALTLSVDVNPQGVTGSGSVAAGETAGTLNLTVPQGVADGTYALRMVATDGTLTRNATFNLVVGAGVTLDLSIPKLYITQATQNLAGDVPLVQGVDAVLRAFVTANHANSASPAVRVRVFAANDTLLQTYTVPAPKTGVPTSVDESRMDASWNQRIPGAYLQAGCKILVDVDPAGELPETDKGNNAWPATGAPQALDVRTVAPFRITFVPITTGDGRTGKIDAASMPSFTSLLEKVWPVGPTVERTFASEAFTVSDVLQEGDANNAWSSLLNKLDAKRVADVSSTPYTGHYFGVVNPSYSSGITGMGYIGTPTALGWDKTVGDGYKVQGSNVGTCAHEVSHNFGLNHAPCGGAAGPDVAFPYLGGGIGVWGLDLATMTLKDPAQFLDIMGYCDPQWVSDYNYKKVLQTRMTSAPSVQASMASLPGPSLLLWGRLDGDRAVLEPAFHLPSAPQLPETGDQLLEGFDANGQRLFTVRFALHAIGDHPELRSFAFSIPLDASQLARLCSLRWSKDGRVVARRDEAGDPRAARVMQPAERQELADGVSRVTWDGQAEPTVLVRDSVTGRVLGIGSGGDFRLRLPAGIQEFHFSSGVRSRMQRMETAR